MPAQQSNKEVSGFTLIKTWGITLKKESHLDCRVKLGSDWEVSTSCLHGQTFVSCLDSIYSYNIAGRMTT